MPRQPVPPPTPASCQVVISSQAKAAYLVSGTTWISFDLPQTIYMKILAARERGLGGLMVRAGTVGTAPSSQQPWRRQVETPVFPGTGAHAPRPVRRGGLPQRRVQCPAGGPPAGRAIGEVPSCPAP